jgi:hypothetical protein
LAKWRQLKANECKKSFSLRVGWPKPGLVPRLWVQINLWPAFGGGVGKDNETAAKAWARQKSASCFGEMAASEGK